MFMSKGLMWLSVPEEKAFDYISCPIHLLQVSDLVATYLNSYNLLIEPEGRKHKALSYVNQPSSTKYAAYWTGVIFEAYRM